MTNKLKFTQVSRVICPKTGVHHLDAIDENGIHWVAQQEIGVNGGLHTKKFGKKTLNNH